MNPSTPTDRRIGTWSAGGVAVIIVIYVVVGFVGVLARPPGSPTLEQVDPYLGVLEVLMILSAVGLVVMMSAVCAYAAAERKTFALAALAFMIVFAVLTCSVHFVSLTVRRQTDPAALPVLFHQLSTGDWPTVAMALDLLAWDFFLGLSLLFAAPVFEGVGSARGVRVSMAVTGALCLAGTLGPATGQMAIQCLGIAGYGFALALASALLAIFFRNSGTESG